VLAVNGSAQGVLAAQASMVAALISHRLRLRGSDLPLPDRYKESLQYFDRDAYTAPSPAVIAAGDNA
jgi:hypothetical protein